MQTTRPATALMNSVYQIHQSSVTTTRPTAGSSGERLPKCLYQGRRSVCLLAGQRQEARQLHHRRRNEPAHYQPGYSFLSLVSRLLISMDLEESITVALCMEPTTKGSIEQPGPGIPKVWRGTRGSECADWCRYACYYNSIYGTLTLNERSH